MRVWSLCVVLVMGCEPEVVNGSPWVRITKPDFSTETWRGESVDVVAQVGDGDHDLSELYYRILLDGEEYCAGTPELTSIACRIQTPEDVEASLVSVFVRDPEGAIADAAVGIVYEEPSEPPMVRAEEPTLLDAGRVELVAMVSDEDTKEGDLRVEWRSDVDGLLVGGLVPTEGEVVVEVQLSPGPHELMVIAVDELGQESADAVDVFLP